MFTNGWIAKWVLALPLVMALIDDDLSLTDTGSLNGPTFTKGWIVNVVLAFSSH